MELRGSPSTEMFAPTWGLLLRAIKKGWNCLTLMLLVQRRLPKEQG